MDYIASTLITALTKSVAKSSFTKIKELVSENFGSDSLLSSALNSLEATPEDKSAQENVNRAISQNQELVQNPEILTLIKDISAELIDPNKLTIEVNQNVKSTGDNAKIIANIHANEVKF